MGIALAALFISSPGSAETDMKKDLCVTSDQIHWAPFRRPALRLQPLAGDPAKPAGLYVIRVKFPPGLFSAPHITRRSQCDRDQGHLVRWNGRYF